MSWSQVVFGALLVLVLLALTGIFAWRQVLALRRLRQTPDLPDEEKRYEKSRAYRRLVSCALTLLLAVLLGVLMIFYENRAQRLASERAGFAPGPAPALTADEKLFVRVWLGTVIAILLVLMVVVFLAGADLWATRRYGLRQMRKLNADRRAMIERQVGRMRQERNGAG